LFHAPFSCSPLDFFSRKTPALCPFLASASIRFSVQFFHSFLFLNCGGLLPFLSRLVFGSRTCRSCLSAFSLGILWASTPTVLALPPLQVLFSLLSAFSPSRVLKVLAPPLCWNGTERTRIETSLLESPLHIPPFSYCSVDPPMGTLPFIY